MKGKFEFPNPKILEKKMMIQIGKLPGQQSSKHNLPLSDVWLVGSEWEIKFTPMIYLFVWFIKSIGIILKMHFIWS